MRRSTISAGPKWVMLLVTTLVACTSSSNGASESTTPTSAAPSTYPPLPTTTTPSAPEVLIVGDFLTTDTDGLGLGESIARIGWLPTIDAREDRTIAEGADLLESSRGRGVLPRLIIVSLGANDACLATPIETIEPNIRRIAALAGDEHVVVWVNLQMKDCMARARTINDALTVTAMTTPNFFVADWATDAPIQRLEGDGIHYDRKGSQFRVDYYVSLLRMYATR